MAEPRRRPLTTASLMLFAMLVSLAAGGASLVLAASWTDALLGLSAAAVLGSGATLLGGLAVALGALPPRQRLLPGSIATAVVAAVWAVTLIPSWLPSPESPLAGTQYWSLHTGSRLAYVRLPAQHGPIGPPVVMIHGGPGIANLVADAGAIEPLTRAGHDVYSYAQLGAGMSSRLNDPAGYGLDRGVADLEAVRERLGTPQLILVGHSYGAVLATAYASRFPNRVDAAVLLSPGALNPADESDKGVRARLSLPANLLIYDQVLRPRPLLTYLLLQRNPRAAHRFMPDQEADRRNDTVLALTEPALHCEGRDRPESTSRSGFYAMQYPQSAAAPKPPDLRGQLNRVTARVLLVKGACDYLSWSSVLDYQHGLANSQLLYLPGAGHNVQADQPGPLLSALQRFLQGERIAYAYAGPNPPRDYQGPP